MRKGILLGFLSIASALALPHASGQEFISKPITAEDTWTYKQTREQPGKEPQSYKLTYQVSGKNAEGHYIVQLTNGNVAVGPNTIWQTAFLLRDRICVIDVAGWKSLGLRNSCRTPLVANMSWEADFADQQSKTHSSYKVISREEVQVPAGTYQAIRIESDRSVTETATPDGKKVQSHFTYWYVPEVKGMVKVVRDFLDDSNAKTRITEELENVSVK